LRKKRAKRRANDRKKEKERKKKRSRVLATDHEQQRCQRRDLGG